MIKQGGIYKLRDSDSYIVIVDIVMCIYYYEITTNYSTLPVLINNQCMKKILQHQIQNIGLTYLHTFYKKKKYQQLKNKLDGYLGQITDKQFFNLRIELEDVDFE
mgnify:CR=1 FL=1